MSARGRFASLLERPVQAARHLGAHGPDLPRAFAASHRELRTRFRNGLRDDAARVARAFALPFRLRRYAVRGQSMSPGLRDGDFVLVLKLVPEDRLRARDVVIVPDPRDPSRTLVKRIAAIDAELGVWLLGDCPAHSTDSRTFGHVPANRIRGRVLFAYWPLRRRPDPWPGHR